MELEQAYGISSTLQSAGRSWRCWTPIPVHSELIATIKQMSPPAEGPHLTLLVGGDFGRLVHSGLVGAFWRD